MNFLGVSVLVLAMSAHARNVNYQQPRGSPDFTYRPAGSAARPYGSESAVSPLFSKSLQQLLAKSGPSVPQEYVSQPAAPGLTAQQYYQEQAEPQAVTYSRPSVPSAGAAPSADSQKYAYSAQPQYQQQPQYQKQLQYSSAADVSSFSYSSPVVQYSNQGLVKQLAGKQTTPSHGRPVVYNSAPAASKPQYQQYQASPSVQYVSQNPTDYSSQKAYAAPSASAGAYSANIFSASQSAYSTSPTASSSNAYSAAAGPSSAYSSSAGSPAYYSNSPAKYDDSSDAYQQVAQKNAYSSSQTQPQAVTYQSGLAGEKYSFVQSPNAQEYQSPKGLQTQYVQPSAQQYSTSPQASSSSVYESAALPQVSYSQQVPQSQYYSGVPQSKYVKPGIAFA